MAEKPCLGGIERKGSGNEASSRMESAEGVRETNSSLLCSAKQALPAAPSWTVSILRNGIRRGSFAPSRKTGRFKVLATAGTHLFILLFQ